jgi:hypothetical protein
VQQLLQHALQAAAAAAAAVDDTAGQGASAVTPPQQLQHLRLASFSYDLTGATALLAALPAHSLIHLHLECNQPAAVAQGAEPAAALDGPALAAALARFSCLRQLRLDNVPNAARVPVALPGHSLTHLSLHFDLDDFNFESWREAVGHGAAFAAALAQLSSLQQLRLAATGCHQHTLPGACLTGVLHVSQLTSLTLEGAWSDLGLPLQQLLATPPPLQQLQLRFTHVDGLPALNMAALTQQERLSLSGSWEIPEGSVLPAQLPVLHFGVVESGSILRMKAAAAFLGLQQLQHLSLKVGYGAQEQLLQLQQLPALQHLTLQYQSAAEAADSAPAWAQLSQLRALQFRNGICFDPSRDQAATILSGIKAATRLTQLQLGTSAHKRWAGKVAACCCLAGLKRTRVLNDKVSHEHEHLYGAWDSFIMAGGVSVVYERP